MGCTDPLRRGVGAPHQCPLESVASYQCHFMLTCGCTLPITHRNDRYKWRGEQFLGELADWAREMVADWDALFTMTAVKALGPDNFETEVLESTELFLVMFTAGTDQQEASDAKPVRCT